LLDLTGFICHDGDEEYIAAAAATDTRDGDPVYRLEEDISSSPHEEDYMWADPVALARDSAKQQKEKQRQRKRLQNTLDALEKAKRAREVKRAEERERIRTARAVGEDKVENRSRNESKRKGKGKGKKVRSEEAKDMEREEMARKDTKALVMEDERACRDSGLAEYRKLVDEAVAHALEPTFTEGIADALKTLSLDM